VKYPSLQLFHVILPKEYTNLISVRRLVGPPAPGVPTGLPVPFWWRVHQATRKT